MTRTPTAAELVTALLELPAQLDRIEQAAISRQPIDVTLISADELGPDYALTASEWHLIHQGEDLGQITERWHRYTWSWSRGDQREGTWELHRGEAGTMEAAAAAIISREEDPNPYRGER